MGVVGSIRLMGADPGPTREVLPTGWIRAGPGLARRDFRTRAYRVGQVPRRKVKHMILSAYHFEGDADP